MLNIFVTTCSNWYFIDYQLSNEYNHLLKCIFIDTVAQIKYRSFNEEYFRKADCFIIVYDITNEESFEECDSYCKEAILRKCKKDVNVMLIGKKIDLENRRKIPKEEGLRFANENNYYFRETTCKDISTVVDAFETFIIKSFINNIYKEDI